MLLSPQPQATTILRSVSGNVTVVQTTWKRDRAVFVLLISLSRISSKFIHVVTHQRIDFCVLHLSPASVLNLFGVSDCVCVCVCVCVFTHVP